MAKLTLTDLANLQNETTAVNAINANSALIEDAFDNTLSRDGTSPNEMESVLDMNSHQIVNLPNPSTENSPLRLKDLAEFIGTGVINTLPDGGTTGQILTKISNADYDADWSNSSALDNVFVVSSYATAQDAIDAAYANNGGTVLFDEDYNIPAGGLDLVDMDKPIRLTSYSNEWSGPASTAVNLFYSGTGSAIDARGALYLEIDHLLIYGNNAGCTRLVDFSEGGTPGRGAVGCHIHHCTLGTTLATTSCIGIDLSDTQMCRINNNVIAINSGVGIRGLVPTTGLWSVKNFIEDNYFGPANDPCIQNPGQVWTISNNVFQSTKRCIISGNAGRCDVLNFEGNWIGDFFSGPGTPLVQVNAGVFYSKGNVYANAAAGTCIEMSTSSGALISIGDRLEGTTGININTGNYLTIISPDQQHLPTTLYTGTPATATTNLVQAGVSEFVGQINSGTAAGIAGAIRLYSGTAGANYGQIVPFSGASGAVTHTLPNTSATLLNTSNNVNVSSKVMGTSNTYAATQSSANSIHYLPFFAANTGNNAINVGASSSVFGVNPSIPSIGIGTAPSTVALLTVAGGGATLTGTTQLALSLQPTISSACTSTGVAAYVALSTTASAFTCTTGNGLYIENGAKGAGSIMTNYYALRISTPTMGDTLNYAIYNPGGRVWLGGTLAVGTDVAPAAGSIQASGSIKSSSSSAGIGYVTGAGSTVTQITSKSTAVTLNAITGQITMHNESMATGTHRTFTLNNSTIAATDVVILNIKGSATANAYFYGVDSVGAGTCTIHIYNSTGGSLGEAVVLQFAVIKGSNT
jgi:hypothetical protein